MKGKIFLGGGGNEKTAFEVEGNFFKGVRNVLYIPLAWPNDDFDSCLNWFSNMASSHKKLNIKMLKEANQKINLSQFDAVYIGGGNTFKLLKRLKESGLGNKLIKFYKSGGKIFGGSAGAIIWGNNIEIALICKDKDENKVKLKNTRGFNQVLNYDIQCHFETNQIKEHQNYSKKTGRKVLGIPEETAVIVSEEELMVIGSKKVLLISSNNHKEIFPNSQIS